MSRKPLLILTAAVVASIASPTHASDWAYRTDELTGDFDTSFVPIGLNSDAPEDLQFNKTPARGAWFGELRYGSFDSNRVAVMVVPGDGGATLFLDKNRDRLISENDKVDGAGQVWKIALSADFVQGDEIKSVPRVIQFRYAKDTLLAGTVGYVEGSVQLANQTVPVRRVDANANGRFADETDYVWFDFDRDGDWDVFTERLPFRLMNRHGGKIFSSAADVVGERYTMTEVTGTGTISLNLEALKKRGLKKLSFVMAGRAGTIVNVDATSKGVRVPPDEYRPITAVADFTQPGKDGKSSLKWRYEFVGQPEVKSSSWIQVRKDEVAAVSPLDKIDFGLHLQKSTFEPGRLIHATPTWVTSRGLRIQSVKYGKRAPIGEPKANVRLTDSSGNKVLSRYFCGFA